MKILGRVRWPNRWNAVDAEQPLLDTLRADRAIGRVPGAALPVPLVQTVWLAMSEGGAPSLANFKVMTGDLNFSRSPCATRFS